MFEKVVFEKILETRIIQVTNSPVAFCDQKPH